MSLEELAGQVAQRFRRRSSWLVRVSLFVKVALVALGSLVAIVAQYEIAPVGAGDAAWRVAGLAGAIVAGIGTIFVIFTEEDASSDLENARAAIEAARDHQTQSFELMESLGQYEMDLQRAITLYTAMSSMRGMLEQSIASRKQDLIAAIRDLLDGAKRPLSTALMFEQSAEWTLCVYRAELSSNGKTGLRCIAHHRAIECDVSQARAWPEGVGVCGVAFAKNGEVVVPDMSDAGMTSVFGLSTSLTRPYDADRYKSLAAVPIRVNRDEKAWGVVVATSDEVHHFDNDEEPGLRTVEAVRALAGMVALAISVSRAREQEVEAAANSTQMN